MCSQPTIINAYKFLLDTIRFTLFHCKYTINFSSHFTLFCYLYNRLEEGKLGDGWFYRYVKLLFCLLQTITTCLSNYLFVLYVQQLYFYKSNYGWVHNRFLFSTFPRRYLLGTLFVTITFKMTELAIDVFNRIWLHLLIEMGVLPKIWVSAIFGQKNLGTARDSFWDKNRSNLIKRFWIITRCSVNFM